MVTAPEGSKRNSMRSLNTPVSSMYETMARPLNLTKRRLASRRAAKPFQSESARQAAAAAGKSPLSYTKPVADRWGSSARLDKVALADLDRADAQLLPGQVEQSLDD